MATVSHHAMRRYPVGSLDAPTSIAPSPYYVTSNQRVTTSPDKSKKSWSQRLKLNKHEKSPPPHQHQQQHSMPNHAGDRNIYDDYHNAPSALSRSMKYAESWLYGTVRGIPAPPVHGTPMFAPIPAEVAVVVCSCPEYLNGTKREVKKASICKKCKGSRLPLAPIGGTVRIRSNTAIIQQRARGSAGTMRLPSSSSLNNKSRPSILDSQNDPYDLMRRSRLLSPELKSVKSNDKLLKSRAKSSSPSRSSRSRYRKRSPSPNENSINKSNRSRSAGRTKQKQQECWLDPSEPAEGTVGRRSILRCDVNPYELISKNSRMSEFTPINDDDVFGAEDNELAMHSRKYENILNPLFYNKTTSNSNITAISGQRICTSSSKSSSVQDEGDDYAYDQVDVRDMVKSLEHVKENTKKIDRSSWPQCKQRSESPMRPPRRKQENLSEENEQSIPNDGTDSIKADLLLTTASLSHISTASDTSSQSNSTIKSILKRPSSVCLTPTTFNETKSQQNGSNASLTSSITTTNAINSMKNYPKSNSEKNVAINKLLTGNNKVSINGSVSVNVSVGNITNNGNNNNNSNSNNNGTNKNANKEREKRNSGSHFYLPMPPRKKVQFLVENEIIQDDADDSCEHDFDENEFNSGTSVKDNFITNHSDEQQQQQSVISVIPSSASSPPPSPSPSAATAAATAAAIESDPPFPSVSATVSFITSNNSNVTTETNDINNGNNETTSSADTMVQISKEHVSCNNNGDEKFNGTEFDTRKMEDNDYFLPTSQRTGLRRSFSDRRAKDSAISKVPLFNDTMALRIKINRKDARDIFHNDLTINKRPKEPPPPPPSSLPMTVTKDEKAMPPRPPRRKLSQQGSDIIISDIVTLTDKNSSDVSTNNQELSVNGDEDIYEDYNYGSASVKIVNSPKKSDNCEDKKHPINQYYHPKNEAILGSRLFGNNSNKTVVRVAPLIINRESAAIHRLEIKHNDDDDYDSASAKKTSILISGDDCYSTVNVNDDTPIYQSSVVVNDVSMAPGILNSPTNTVTISVSSPSRTPDEEMIYKNNKINQLLSINSSTSIIPIGQESSAPVITPNRGKTLINLDFNTWHIKSSSDENAAKRAEEELGKLLRDPVEAVRRNLVPHVCGKTNDDDIAKHSEPEVVRRVKSDSEKLDNLTKKLERNSFIAKLLEDPTLGHLAEGLDSDIVAKLIENSLIRLKESRHSLDMSGTKDDDNMTKMIEMSLQKVQEERQKIETQKQQQIQPVPEEPEKDQQSNRGSMSSGNSYGSANYELFDFDNNADSDCYHSCSSELTAEEDGSATRSKFYQMLVDATLSEIEISTSLDDDHHYETIRLNGDPIYEEISEIPPPLPLSPPPVTMNDSDLEKKGSRSIFEGASKYDILSYLVDAKERGIVPEEPYTYNFSNTSDIIVEEEEEKVAELHQRQNSDISSRISHLSNGSDSSEESSLSTHHAHEKMSAQHRKTSVDIERNDSGVGSETSKTSRSRFLHPPGSILDKNSPIHLCEDCDGPVETQITDSGVMYAPLVCRKCGKKRAERKEIITEIVETEEKYGRDLQIILEEFYQPMLVAGLLTQEQLSAIFLNTEELLENNQALAERMRDALDIAMEQGDDDLLTVNIGRLFLEAAPMLHAFETYCVRQAAASLLLANLEKEKELLRIFLRVSQMENTVLRRMNLNSFLMVPVQRVTKYPLLLARLYKVTPPQLEGRDSLKQAQEKIELHLNHMNQEAKDVPTKLWRRISSSSPGRRSSCEIDMINIKLRKMAVDVLEWNHEEVRFAMEGKLLFTQPTDNNWRKGRTIKLTHINALLVTNGKPSQNYKADKAISEPLNFPRHTGIREASLLLVREKSGRYTLLREPLYLDRCIVCTEADWDDYFEVQEISSKDTFIFKAEDGVRTKQWYAQLQYHSQGMGAWRKRRNALANIMINGMMMRS